MASLEQARIRHMTAQLNCRRAELEFAGKVVGLVTTLIYLGAAGITAVAALVVLL